VETRDTSSFFAAPILEAFTPKKNFFFLYYHHHLVRPTRNRYTCLLLSLAEDQMSHTLAGEISVLQSAPEQELPNEPDKAAPSGLEASARLFLLGKPVTPDSDRKRPLYVPRHRRAA
jgi:hypothetical protein